MSVMLTTRGPSHTFVSPPAIATWNCSARGSIPSSSGSAMSVCARGNATARKAATGSAAMAAKSLRFTARALRPIRCGESFDSEKWVPSQSRSQVTTDPSGCRIAASSPGPTASCGLSGNRFRKARINSISIGGIPSARCDAVATSLGRQNGDVKRHSEERFCQWPSGSESSEDCWPSGDVRRGSGFLGEYRISVGPYW